MAAARQLSGRRGPAAARPADFADQHRHGTAVDAGRPRPRLHLHRNARPAARADADDAGRVGAVPGPFLQLVRHGDARAASSPLCLDRRQRQPGRGAPHAGEGLTRLAAEPQKPATRVEGLIDTAEVLDRGLCEHGRRRDDRPRPRPIESAGSQHRHGSPQRAANRRSAPVLRRSRVRLPRRRAPSTPETRPPRAGDLAFWSRAVVDAVDDMLERDDTSSTPLQALARRASALADAMRFDFLYDRRRRIFAIGYRLADADGPGASRRFLLRPAGLRSAAGELHRHRQGRRAAASLVSPRATRDRASAAARR